MKPSLIVTVASVLVSSTALANPIMVVQELRGQAIAGVHVKLSYTHNYGGTPVSATVHGTSHSPWVSVGSTSRDTGSGVRSMPILEMCDCHVATGTSLNYALVFEDGSTSSLSLDVEVPPAADFERDTASPNCLEPCRTADAADAGAVATGGASGSGGATATGGTTATTDSTATGGTSGGGGTTATPPPPDRASGGCAFLSSRASPVLLSLALLGLAITALRRRS